jgi:hypothetical protein
MPGACYGLVLINGEICILLMILLPRSGSSKNTERDGHL